MEQNLTPRSGPLIRDPVQQQTTAREQGLTQIVDELPKQDFLYVM